MFNIFKAAPTVEQIHAAFDEAAETLIPKTSQECEKLASELSSTNNKKVSNLESLGFTKSEPVVKAEAELDQKMNKKERYQKLQKTLQTLKQFQVEYPTSKFITVEDLKRLCTKYNLVHAPVSHYIKDVPDKNVDEMMSTKPLNGLHTADTIYIWRYEGDILKSAPKSVVKKMMQGVEIPSNLRSSSAEYICRSLFGKNYTSWSGIGVVHRVDRTGFHIAAPKSHFDLKGLDHVTQHGFFESTVVRREPKDPTVFEYCKDDLVRLISKWGTDDDQSHLDPIVLNEKLN